ncbi:MAG: hypothetical protein QOH05_4123 [Acetobacteraceae bacterium]|nr:hypothetical protein [Acetobacteraceae bacterium]
MLRPLEHFHPEWVSDDIITTGIGRSAMIFSRKTRSSMRGISISSVRTSGFSDLIMSRATRGSGAAPTTVIAGSDARIWLSICRTRAESSTISTRILGMRRPQNNSIEPATGSDRSFDW